MDNRQRDEDLNEALLPAATRKKKSPAIKTKTRKQQQQQQQHHVVTFMTESPPASGQSGISSPRTTSQPRRNSTGQAKQVIGKPSRPRKAVAQFRKQRRDWSTWTGRIGIHLPVDEFQIDELASSSSFSTNLHSNGWNYDDLFDVIRLWQVEPPINNNRSDEQQKELWKGYYPPPIYDTDATDEEFHHQHLYQHQNNTTQGQEQQPPPPPPPPPARHQQQRGIADMSSAVLPEVYIFSFGAVVFWNFPNAESELKWMNDNLLTSTLSDCYGDAFADDEIETATDDMGFKFVTANISMTQPPTHTNSTARPPHILGETSANAAGGMSAAAASFSLQRDVATLTTLEYGQRLAISFAFAKSSLLSIYEQRVQHTIERNSHIPEELATHGTINMTRREIAQEVGRLFLVKHGINLDNSLIDTPEELWNDDRFEPTYETTIRYFQIPKRLELVNNRLTMIGDLHQVLTEQTENQHGVTLEWIIIILIVAEVVLDLLHFYVHY